MSADPERLVLFVRHAIAEERSEHVRDFDRALTATGTRRMKKIAAALVRIFPDPEAIVSSPYVRCAQTALLLRKAYGGTQLRTDAALGADAEPTEIAELVRASSERRLIVVGHEPNLTDAVAELLGMSCRRLTLKKGGCCAIAMREGEEARLEWMLPPRLLRRF